MIISIKQTNKELYSAQFQILHEDKCVGNIAINGHMGSMDADVEISVFDKNLKLSCTDRVFRQKRVNKKETAFRQYKILQDNTRIGSVCQIDKKKHWFSEISFHRVLFGSDEYNMYPIGMGNDGGKNPIYKGNSQIAQINTSPEVIDDMHSYNIYALGKNAAEIAVIFSVYMYILSGFHPGEKVKRSYVKYFSTTTNKDLKSKYDPKFEKNTKI